MMISNQEWNLAAEAVRANQLTRLFQFVYTTASKIVSKLPLIPGSEKAYNERLRIGNVTFHREVASIPLGGVSRKSCSVSS